MLKVTVIMEAKNRDTLPLDDIMGSLTTHEISLKSLSLDEEKAKSKNSKRGIALKCQADKSESKRNNENDVALLAKQIGIYFHKIWKGRQTEQNFTKGDKMKQNCVLHLQQA